MTIPRMERQNGATPFPLSASQEQLWYFNQLAPGSPVYNVVDLIDLGESYNSQTLRKVTEELVRRHETLRTAFSSVGGQAMQVVLPTAEVELLEFDLSSLSEAERESEWTRVVREQTHRPFDLSQAPLIRLSAIHRSAKGHDLLVVIHHIITDEWGTGILHREITQLYEDFSLARPSSLSELPIQFADFACWQKESLQGGALEKHVAYWKNELAGAPHVLELTTDKPRPTNQSFRGAWEAFQLPPEVADPLKSLSRQERATLFMTLLAGFMALLYRYTGQDDILVGTPISLRRLSETENLVGYFLNTVILRAQFTEGQSFRSLLQQVRKRAFGAFAHADLPFNNLVAELAPERDLSRTPLFQVAFILHDRDGVSEISKASGRSKLGTGSAKFDLGLFVSETKNGLDVSIEYSTDLFEAETIRRMGKHFGTLLEAIGSNPDESITRLNLLTATERNLVLNEWNATKAEYRSDKCVHELFEEQAARTPNALAAVLGDAKLTYGELNQRANQLAHYLRELGVKPDARVAVCGERSFEVIVAFLAVLKAGGAYLPLEPDYPADRLRFMIEDAQPAALLTQNHLAGLFADIDTAPPVLRLDAAASPWKGQPVSNPSSTEWGLNPLNLAYIIYTSGSTGHPKGVMVPHRAINRLVINNRFAKIGPGDRVAFAANPAFDASTLELWAPLLNGGCIVVVPQAVLLEPVRFGEVLRTQKVDLLWLTVGLFNQYAETLGKYFAGLRYLMVGGDALNVGVIARALQNHPPQHLLNGYGPTETTTFATTFEITSVREDARSIPIGRPIGNTQAYILNAQREPVPVGVPGELYIGGAGVARGYLNRPELTAERFLPDPFSTEPGARMYRTGDLTRWLSDGTIEFLGRNDFQVKIRGFRIELGEIEARLAEHPAVREAVVVVREDTPGDKRLVAYYTAAPLIGEAEGGIVGAEQFRSHMSASLPDYMTPAAYVRLESVPLTFNGKLDRKALPSPDQDSYSTHRYEPPEGELETKLAGIWAEVLKLERVGRHDNFFDLGGHSLLAVQLMLKLQEIIPGEALPLRAVLEAPTVERFADWLVNRGEDQAKILVRMRPGSCGRQPFFCVHGAGGNVLSLRPLAMALPSDLPIYVLQAKGLDGSEPFETVEETARFYVEEIRRVQPHGPFQIGGMSYGSLVAFEMARVLDQLGESVSTLLLIDCTNPAFAKQMPKTELVSRLVKFSLQRMAVHSRTMARLKPHEWLDYLEGPFKALNRYLRGLVRAKPKIEEDRSQYDRDWEKMKSASGTRLGEILERVGRASRIAGAKFVPKPYRGSAVIVRSSDHWPTPYEDDYLGWKTVVQGPIENFEVNGTHESMFEDPDVHTLAASIDIRLRKAPAEKEEAA